MSTGVTANTGTVADEGHSFIFCTVAAPFSKTEILNKIIGIMLEYYQTKVVSCVVYLQIFL